MVSRVAEMLWTEIADLRLLWTVKTMQRGVAGKRNAVDPEQAGDGYTALEIVKLEVPEVRSKPKCLASADLGPNTDEETPNARAATTSTTAPRCHHRLRPREPL